jgi:hypothetical protein
MADNKWRDRANDGSDYGLIPEDFDTEEEYNGIGEVSGSHLFGTYALYLGSSSLLTRLCAWDTIIINRATDLIFR